MRKLTFMMATMAIVALAFSSCKKEEEKPLVINVEQTEVPGEMGNFVKLVAGEKTVEFDGKKASFDLDVTTLKQARYCEDASITISLLNEQKQPLGDFANLTTDTEVLKKALQGTIGNYTVKVTSAELSEEQIKTIKEKAKYAAATAAQGIDTWYFTGNLNGKYPVHIAINPEMTEGTYYYDKSGVNNPMYLDIIEFNPEDNSLQMEETNADRMVCGYWDVKVDKEAMEGRLNITFSGKTYGVNLDRYKETPKAGEFSDPNWKK